jgi:hypothetical protein
MLSADTRSPASKHPQRCTDFAGEIAARHFLT